MDIYDEKLDWTIFNNKKLLVLTSRKLDPEKKISKLPPFHLEYNGYKTN